MYGFVVFKSRSTGIGRFGVGLLVVVSVFSVTCGQSTSSCEHGTYGHAGETCCLCAKGYYVFKHCSSQDPHPLCEVCPPSAYTSEANFLESCEPCSICNPKANVEEEKPCTPTSNAVCRCKSGHFCEREPCKACHPCDECQWGEKEPCTPKTNAVCKERPVAGIAVGVVFTVLVIVAFLAFLSWWRKKLCFAKKETAGHYKVVALQNPKDLTDIDLTPHVVDIVNHLSWSDMVKVAYKTGMTKAQVERHQADHPLNAEEQTRSLLLKWIEEQGLTNASNTFCKTLRECNLRQTANEIERIITKTPPTAEVC